MEKNIIKGTLLALSIVGMLGMGWSCVDEDAPENWAPGFKTISSENVMRTTATLIGELSGSVNLAKEYGFQYSESSNFPADKTENVLVGEDAPSGSFRADIHDLEPNQRYYYRVYASTKSTTVYSEPNNFDTPSSSAPTLSYISTDSIGENYVRMTCRVDDIGDEYLLEYGVGYKTKDEKSYTPVAAEGFIDEAERKYVVEIYNLEPSTAYTFRPYAKNSLDASGSNGVREGYGNTFEERTEDLLSPDVETSVGSAGISSVRVSGVVYSADGSNGELLDCGFVWSSTNEEPRIELNDEHTISRAPEQLEEYFGYTITGLMPNTTYYVCAFARNQVGDKIRIGYGKAVSFTTGTLVRPNLNIDSFERDATSITVKAIFANYDEGALAEKGLIYSRSNAEVTLEEATAANTVVKVTAGAKEFSGTIQKLTMNTSYFVRAYAVYKAENVDPVVGYSSSFEITTSDFQTPGIELEYNQENITRKSIELTGKIISQGNGTITERGFVLIKTDISDEPTLEHTKAIKVKADESFVSVVDGLEYGTNYVARSYVTSELADKVKTVYSGSYWFTTKAVELPRFNNLNVSDASFESFKVSCGISNVGDGTLIEKGFCWKKNKSEFELADCSDAEKIKIDSQDNVSFEHTVTGIQANSNYYVRAYAKVDVDGVERIVYSNSSHVGSQSYDLPGLESPLVNDETLTRKSVDLEAVIYNEGNGTISQKGFVLSLTSTTYEPTLKNCLLKVEADADFKATVNDLTPNTEYAAQAFAIVNWGESKTDTVYSSWRTTFWTKAIVTATFNNVQLEDATYHSVKATSGISEMGDGTFIEKGFFWKRNSTDFSEGKDSVIVTSDDHGEFTLDITGLESDSWYYIGAYTKNNVDGKDVIASSGWSEVWISSPTMPTFDNFTVENSAYKTLSANVTITNQGDGEILEKGFCWTLVEDGNWTDPTLDKNLGAVAIEGALEGFSTLISGLQIGKEYGVRAYAKVKLANKETVAYSYCKTITVDDADLPGLDYYMNVLNTTRNSAEVKAAISRIGNGTITHRGFVLSLASKTYSPTIDNCEKYWDDVDETFTMTITGLKHNTEYAVRAFVVAQWEEDSDTIIYNQGHCSFRTNEVVKSTFNNVELTDETYHSVKVSSGVSSMGEGEFIEKGFFYWHDDEANRDSVIVTSDTHQEYSTVIDNLESDRWYYVRAYTKTNADGVDVISTSSYSSVGIPSPEMSYIDNFNVEEEGYKAVRPTASIVQQGEGEIIESGFCWNLLPEEGDWLEPSVESHTGIVKMEGDLLNLTARVEDLTPNREYYIRAYAKVRLANGERVIYSYRHQFRVQGPNLPTLNYRVDIDNSKITRNSAELKTGIEYQGNGTITQRGFVLAKTSKTTEPDIENCDMKWDDVDETFTKVVTGLEYNTEYIVRGFVVAKWEEESDTIIYSRGSSTFRTLSAVMPTFTALAFGDQGLNTFTVSSEITAMGDGTLKEKGFCWNRATSDFGLDTETTESKAVEGEGNALTLTVGDLEPNTRYYVKAYAKVDVDGNEMVGYSGWSEVWTTAYNHPSVNNASVDDEQVTRTSAYLTSALSNQGNGVITERGFVLSLTSVTHEPTLENNVAKVVADENFTATVTGLTANTEYAVRAYIISKWEDSGFEETVYSGRRSTFRTDAVAVPTFNAISASDATYSSMKIKCGIASLGDAVAEDFVEKGFLWSTEYNSTLDNCIGSKKVEGGTNAEFTDSIGGLVPGTYYYFRAYAKVKVDGNEVIGYSDYVHSRTSSLSSSWSVTTQAKECDFALTFNDEADKVVSVYLNWSTNRDELNAGNGTKFELTQDETTLEFKGKLENLNHDTTYYYKVYYVYAGNEIELRSSDFHTKRLPQADDNVSPDKKE